MKTIKIYGYGWVGKAMKTLFPDANVHDPMLGYIHNTKCDIAFVCVPTPCVDEGKLETSIVEEVIRGAEEELIIVRSTVNPGDCDRWTEKYGKQIVMQPEYLGETANHPFTDQKSRPFLILGGKAEATRQCVDLYATVYNANVSITLLTAKEAELVKLTENRAIFFKVSQCQELYDVCEKAGMDYYKIRDAVYKEDPRFNLWWTFVYPDKRGANSKCIPKDVNAWCAFAESLGYTPEITRALLERNKKWISQ